MKILLYSPDNGVTRNFMPHLWMFLLQSLTPPGHEVILIDGNARAMTEAELVEFCQAENIELVGIGAMTRMIARAYKVADAIRAAGIKVVMGGAHVTEVPDEALGRNGGVRHADAVALGEADETWAQIVTDAANGCLKEVYQPETDAKGNDKNRRFSPIRTFLGKRLTLTSLALCRRFCVRICPNLARAGELSTLCRLRQGAAVPTAASSAR